MEDFSFAAVALSGTENPKIWRPLGLGFRVWKISREFPSPVCIFGCEDRVVRLADDFIQMSCIMICISR